MKTSGEQPHQPHLMVGVLRYYRVFANQLEVMYQMVHDHSPQLVQAMAPATDGVFPGPHWDGHSVFWGLVE